MNEMPIDRLLLWVLIACLPLAGALYWAILRRARAVAPGLLEQIDPQGFRAMNASSQLRFSGYVNAGRYREVRDVRLRQLFGGFRWLFWGYCVGWLVFLMLMLR